jgi:[ribosomal protein S5]-alanine N-acetyltransferase
VTAKRAAGRPPSCLDDNAVCTTIAANKNLPLPSAARARTLLLIRTERLVLHPLTEGDLEAFASTLMSDPFVHRSFPGVAATSPGHARREFIRARYFKGFEDVLATDGFVNWGLYARGDGARRSLLGWCGVHRLSGLHLAGPELGYALVGSHQRQGLMSEAARAVIRHVFSGTNIPCLHAIISPANAESQRFATSLGFERQGAVTAYGRSGMQLYHLGRHQDANPGSRV